jgi:predicted esterase
VEFVDRVVALHDALVDVGLPHAFGGALSLAYHATPRGTVEIDLNVFLSSEHARSTIEQLEVLGVAAPANGIEGAIPTAGLRCPWDDTHVDVFLSYDEDFFASVRARVENHAFEDSGHRLHDLPFISAEDLCIFKITFNRQKDWADIEAMLEEAPLNEAYVQHWLLHLRGEHEWPRIRRFLELSASVTRPWVRGPESAGWIPSKAEVIRPFRFPDRRDVEADDAAENQPRWTRRKVLMLGVGGVAAIVGAGAVGVELVDHGVLPGKSELDQLDGACSVSSAPFAFSALGPSRSGTFFSHARGRSVGYTLAYPQGHVAGTRLPLVVVLHGYGGNHTNALSSMTLPQACALRIDGHPLPPMALVSVDGGGGYWNRHPGDDPMAMVFDELIPLCQEDGLGLGPKALGAMGISMGGYGALLFAEKHPERISAVAAISPAVWTSYEQARASNAGAYASAEDFDADDVVTHAAALRDIPVRVASGSSDPFRPGVEALSKGLPRGAHVEISAGCHTGSFFNSQEGPSLAFLGAHLTA